MQRLLSFLVILFVILFLQLDNPCLAQNCITIDETKMTKKGTGCGDGPGYIRGVEVTGALGYEWIDGNGKVVGTGIDLENITTTGLYQLRAFNANTGCEKFSSLIEIPAGGSPLPPYTIYGVNAACNANTGSLHIDLRTLPRPTRIEWTTAADPATVLGRDPDIFNLDLGIYNLYLYNAEGCRILYKTTELKRIPTLNVNFSAVTVKDDECGQSLGSIQGIILDGGLGPFVFTWSDVNGTVVGYGPELLNVAAGSYTVTVSDQCAVNSGQQTFVVGNKDKTIAPPRFNNVRICIPEELVLTPISKEEGVYRYYSSETSLVPLYEAADPAYRINVKQDQSFYVSLSVGKCESIRTKVDIKLGISAIDIPNTFTPNGDGINDTWNLYWLNGFTTATVRIFDRSGNLVYDYPKNKNLFDGVYEGRQLPVGTYYYMIDLGSQCKRINNTLFIVR